MYSIYFIKKTKRSDSTLRHSTFDILRFCGSLLGHEEPLFRSNWPVRQPAAALTPETFSIIQHVVRKT